MILAKRWAFLAASVAVACGGIVGQGQATDAGSGGTGAPGSGGQLVGAGGSGQLPGPGAGGYDAGSAPGACAAMAYNTPGCGGTAPAPVCEPGYGGACASVACSCDGQTIMGDCGYLHQPFRFWGACAGGAPGSGGIGAGGIGGAGGGPGCVVTGCPAGSVCQSGQCKVAAIPYCADGASVLATRLDQALGSTPGLCTISVRVSAQTLQPLAYAYRCGPYQSVTGSQALDTALVDLCGYSGSAGAGGTGGGGCGIYTPGSDYVMGPVSKDEYVFQWGPSDEGAVVAVNAETDLPVVGMSMLWQVYMSSGYPDQQERSPAELGQDCTGAAVPSAHGFRVGAVEGPLGAPALAASTGVVWKTVVPAAINIAGLQLHSVLVLEYDLKCDPEHPGPMVYEVMVNAGTP